LCNPWVSSLVLHSVPIPIKKFHEEVRLAKFWNDVFLSWDNFIYNYCIFTWKDDAQGGFQGNNAKTHSWIWIDKETIKQEDEETQDHDWRLNIKIKRKTPYHLSSIRRKMKHMQGLWWRYKGDHQEDATREHL